MSWDKEVGIYLILIGVSILMVTVGVVYTILAGYPAHLITPMVLGLITMGLSWHALRRSCKTDN